MYRAICLLCGDESIVDLNADGESTIKHIGDCPSRLRASGLEIRNGANELYLIAGRGVRESSTRASPSA
jgi:hypothetical protein